MACNLLLFLKVSLFSILKVLNKLLMLLLKNDLPDAWIPILIIQVCLFNSDTFILFIISCSSPALET